MEKVFGDVGIHAMEGSFDLRFEEGVKFFEEGLQMREIVVQQVCILEAVLFCKALMHAKSAGRSYACIEGQIPRNTTS